MNLFYQVFDKGSLSDGEGRHINFRNTIIILTSNLATDEIMKVYDRDEPPSVEDVVNQIRPILSKHFKPALLARMTIVPYAPINRTIMREITQMRLGGLAKRLATSHKIETKFAPSSSTRSPALHRGRDRRAQRRAHPPRLAHPRGARACSWSAWPRARCPACSTSASRPTGAGASSSTRAPCPKPPEHLLPPPPTICWLPRA
jgi:hypothetical protein